MVWGEKLWSWVKRWRREVWSRERNYGPGSSAGGGKCGPGSQTAARVKPVPARVWSEERNYGLGSSAGGGKYGPGSQTAGLGQAQPRPSVVRGEKLWSLVKRWWREVWSREPNRAPGSPPSPPECGPRREIMVLGQTLVAGSVVQGEKLRFWVKPCLARVWSEERNYGLWSSADGGKYGPGSQTAGLGQAQPRPSVVRGAKLRPWVKPVPAKVWSREPNCGPGSSSAPPKHGLGSQTVPRVKPVPAEAWSREPNRAPGSPPSPPECGPRREIMVLGQALVAGSVVQGAKPCPRVTPCPAEVWSREQNRAPGSSPSPPKCGLGSQTVPPALPECGPRT